MRVENWKLRSAAALKRKCKTKYACIVKANEYARKHMEGTPHGMNSLSHYNLVHKLIPMPQAMKIPDAKAAVDKE